MARPRTISDEKLIQGVDDYLAECKEILETETEAKKLRYGIPQVSRYAERQGLTRKTIYQRANQCEELGNAIKKIIDSKERLLEEYALLGLFNNTMAIFSLKQIGWKDKVESTSEDKSITIKFENATDEYGD